ncbi:MAG: helix-turn-helix transcriptional regulator [Acidaminococcaceae bacterium]|nr:helix-turn-helix transcriptional regulator [Acidaminococcaceae bacterium]
MRFSEILQDLREDRDISRKEMASYLNISLSTLGMYEQGRREPNIEMLIRIADYFNVSLDFLVGRDFTKIDLEKYQEALHLKNKIDKLPQGYKDIVNFMLETQE